MIKIQVKADGDFFASGEAHPCCCGGYARTFALLWLVIPEVNDEALLSQQEVKRGIFYNGIPVKKNYFFKRKTEKKKAERIGRRRQKARSEVV